MQIYGWDAHRMTPNSGNEMCDFCLSLVVCCALFPKRDIDFAAFSGKLIRIATQEGTKKKVKKTHLTVMCA